LAWRSADACASAALAAGGPNARDYYVQGANAYRTAAAQHAARLASIDAVYRDLEKIGEAIVDQGRAK